MENIGGNDIQHGISHSYFCILYYLIFVWTFAILFYSFCKISESDLCIKIINPHRSENTLYVTLETL